ncbi:type I restriction-modification system DNA methylase subunit [Neisseria perflava]|uniref:Eco57I restriction-modification methylase domain-containing protein n=1 Tax=Neisseria perflava TaxID=33053 RepID=UPI00209DCEFC|nr:N-6 DNA methylase [Neisseria perflava]MCP1771952.1 type I restriction-modification system DNA methylase subunit [Neisseria perflava]
MSFFQQTVVSQYLKQQDAAVIRRQWAIFQAIFHDAAKQQNIRNSKEEQYQEGFLRDLFVAVLGHTINPEPDWNLITEQKNQTDGKKADAAVHHGGKVIAVIELKGTDTTALDKIQAQAFGYKNNQSGCRYVVVSNFQKLRFYIDNAVEYLEWDLFALTEAQFGLLWLCLQRHNLESGLPARLKSETVSREEAITARLYRDYSAFKRELFADMVANNPQYGELELFKKSQKLLDRFLFILFAEDRHLLPANEINTIIGQWQQLKELDEDKPLYEKIKQYFNHLNTGHQAKRGEIFAYNGGLFKPDALLDSLIISDSVLLAHLTRLAEYDFNSDVDVNILGHIFENSLNEIDEIKARINGETIDKKQSKRKKDGVFYTPRYITRYIVDQTVGALCRAKKTELAIDDEDYAYTKPTAKNRPILEGRLKTLETYRDWLLQLTICDPACGSGAFLNEALNFLIAEHRYIDELSARLGGGELVYQNIENSILERNLYGVDINEESVEIAKLSLWLRTAQPHRKLSSLSSNIKCGNSLISDPQSQARPPLIGRKNSLMYSSNYPPDKSGNTASKQGFDVIIGNPPYGAKIQKQEQKFYLENYETPAYKLDSYSIFIEKSMDLVKQNGSVGLIVPYTCLTIEQHFKLRQFLLNYDFESIINLPQKVFTDADLDTIIIKINKCSPKKIIHLGSANGTEIISNESIIRYETISKNADYLINMYLSDNDVQLVDKLRSFPVLSEQFDVSQGLIPYDKYRGHSEETIKNRIWHADYKKDETYKKELKGVDISRYFIEWNGNLWVSYGDWLAAPREKKYFTSP